ncbi:hypothetical protein [Chryseobacterium sp. c4a]|uniref:hypothetical protein n=1 Tax=Chryseobacterium sp. c4a TaxID=1573582 RepID=UPI00135BB45A|nr:hypothetical protein [Chryseobacterium sp. c4a]
METISQSLKSILIKNGFRNISETEFSEKLNIYFEIDSFDSDTIILFNQKGYTIDIKNRFINTYPFEPYYIKDYVIDEGLKNEYTAQFINYNKIIFNDNLSAVTSILNDKMSIEEIFYYFDYEKNRMLNMLALREIDYNNLEPDYIQHLFLYNNTKDTPIKSNVISYIIQNYKESEQYFLDIIEVLFNFWDHIYSKDQYKFQLTATLTEKLLEKYEQKMDIEKCTPLIQYLYCLHDNLPEKFDNEKYFDQHLLKKYSIQYFATLDHSDMNRTE